MTDTLKFICGQCTHLNSQQLDFIPLQFERHREIVARDLRELVSAAASESEKSVVVLAGGVLEAILYTLIAGQVEYIAERRGTFEFNPDHSLQNYINIFNRWLSGLLPTAALSDSVVEYRDLVHFNRELNSPPGFCAMAAREMLLTVDALLGALSEFAAR